MKLKYYLDMDWARLVTLMGEPAKPRRISAFFNPRFLPIVIIRYSSFFYSKGYRGLAKIGSLLNFVIFGIEVPARLEIGPGLVIPHPQGIVLGAARIGNNFTIFHQVTLGAKEIDFVYDERLRPSVGNDVTISVGAKILGGIALADGCMVGANAVVIRDVPAGNLAVGVPARNKTLQGVKEVSNEE